MRFSRNWIAAYVDLPDDVRELADSLSMLGLVVDDLREIAGDVILDLDLPSNRPDVLNHLEIARELAVAGGRELRVPERLYAANAPPSEKLASITIDDTDGCTRFVGHALIDVEVGPSPDWLRERLEAIGLRAINNVVDVTNYVMWELGRPLHAYDLDALHGSKLVVRRARPGESLTTLDEVERKLTADDMIIADEDRAIGLAGVMGGAQTGVTEATSRVLIECARFDPRAIRAMARRHGIHTDASHRFERGMSHQGIGAAVDRVCNLLAESAGARVSSSRIDVRTTPEDPRVLQLRLARLRGYLGVDVPVDELQRILNGLQFQNELNDDAHEGTSGLRVIVPPRRTDVTREVDLIEEIARFYGYDRLPNTLPVLRRTRRHGPDEILVRERHLRQVLAALGHWEAITFAFTGAPEQRRILTDSEELVRLDNPLSEAMAVLRRQLLPGLLGAVSGNLKQGASRIRLFEVGRTFAPPADAPVERRHLAVAITGLRTARHFEVPPVEAGMADLKGAIEVLAARIGWPEFGWAPGARAFLQQGAAAEILIAGVSVGFAGKLAAETASDAGIGVPTWVAELDIQDLLTAPSPGVAVEALPRFPSSTRDVSLAVPTEVPYGRVRETVASIDDVPLVAHELLDVYREGDRADAIVTVRLTYRAPDRTLTAEEIEAAHRVVLDRLAQQLGLRTP